METKTVKLKGFTDPLPVKKSFNAGSSVYAHTTDEDGNWWYVGTAGALDYELVAVKAT